MPEITRPSDPSTVDHFNGDPGEIIRDARSGSLLTMVELENVMFSKPPCEAVPILKVRLYCWSGCNLLW